MRRIAMVFALFGALGALTASPASAQMFSEGYEFLKAVKDRDGDAVTEALNQPGTTIVNTRDLTSGETALHIVTERRDAIWIRFLTSRGANPNIRDKKGVYPIQLAVTLGYLEGVEALIKAGAQIEVTNNAGETPLIAAVHRRDAALIRLLLEKGANPDRSDNSGRTARDYASLMTGNSTILAEFERADTARKEKGASGSYGPGA
ncbi:ankyrin repeat domain-containing protein [Altererythrobacter sp. BO-6]|nr:ankyrin repeat domain-containing protein [Altererythrobacter sp. BO-6]QIG55458.1 ankyrin repeat domain-containing protein [Altererythrobacter sp. BO-6]